MDFIALANSHHQLLRHLNGDDDFGRIDNDGSRSNSFTKPPLSLTSEDSYEQLVVAGKEKLLSPSAEAELFLLATNFLLYVALVIIITLVAKIYFPESLERRNDYQPSSRSYSYRRVGETNSHDQQETTGSDSLSDDEVDSEENLDSGDEQDDMKPPPAVDYHKQFLEFDQEAMPKNEVIKRLAFCCLMLNVTFITWGILQERMLTRRYPRGTGEYFTYSYALVFTNRFWTLIMSGLLLLYLKPRRSRSTVIYEYSFPSISNMLSSWCQYEALRYVSFPATALFKCFKLAPVMLMGKMLGNKTYPQYDYMVSLAIGIGITMFMSSSDELSFGTDIYGKHGNQAWTGVLLLFLYLFFDSFTGQWQSRMFQRHKDLSMVELMFATSAFSTVLSLVTLVHTNELGPALNFVYRHSEIHLHFFMFSICSTIGQIFIFYTIKNFGAVVFTLIMTARILLSIAVSCVLYGHKVSAMGFLGLMFVSGAVLYRIKRKTEGTQLLKWQGLEDTKAQELVQEWHEHLDM